MTNLKEGYLTEAEVFTLSQLARQHPETGARDGLLILALYYTAARVSEVLAIKPEDLLPSGNIKLNWQKHKPKGAQERFREVGVPAWLHEELRKYAVEKKLKPGSHYFDISRIAVWQLLDKLGRKISRKVHPHLFRHSRAISVLQKTNNLKYVQLMLGHTSIQSTMIYLNYLDSQNAATAIKALNEKRIG